MLKSAEDGKTDKIMKDVYTHTFSEERAAADNIVDNYFAGIINQKQKVSELLPNDIIKISDEQS